jgi:AP-1 complex subunit beta-1
VQTEPRPHSLARYLCDPLRKCLKDDDPYVRKTAAVCVAKLYDIDQTLVLEQGFIESLQDLLSDANPMVVANAVAALSEMHECDPTAKLFDMNPGTVSKLLTALNECTEWGQIFILDSLALYVPEDQRELQSICERVSPRLQHVNAAVVLSAVKVIMKLLAAMADEEYKTTLLAKLAPPLVTLLSSEPEIQ